MDLMTKTEIERIVGKKNFFSGDNILAAKLIYISGIRGFDNYLGKADQRDKKDVIHLKEMPKGFIIGLAKNFSSNEVGIKFEDIESITLVKFQKYSVLKFIYRNLEIYFGIDNEDILDVEEFFNSIDLSPFVEFKKTEVPFAVKNKVENYFLKNTNLFSINTDHIKASKTKRFLNFLVDGLIISLIIELLKFKSVSNKEILTPIIVFFIYYLLMEGLFRTTFGKILTNTEVVNFDGTRAKQIFIRTLSRIIPFEPFSFLYFKSGWHDSISKTTVIDRAKRKNLLNNLLTK